MRPSVFSYMMSTESLAPFILAGEATRPRAVKLSSFSLAISIMVFFSQRRKRTVTRTLWPFFRNFTTCLRLFRRSFSSDLGRNRISFVLSCFFCSKANAPHHDPPWVVG